MKRLLFALLIFQDGYPAGIGTDALLPVAGLHRAQSLHLSG
jgi:hypothetical protein